MILLFADHFLPDYRFNFFYHFPAGENPVTIMRSNDDLVALSCIHSEQYRAFSRIPEDNILNLF